MRNPSSHEALTDHCFHNDYNSFPESQGLGFENPEEELKRHEGIVHGRCQNGSLGSNQGAALPANPGLPPKTSVSSRILPQGGFIADRLSGTRLQEARGKPLSSFGPVYVHTTIPILRIYSTTGPPSSQIPGFNLGPIESSFVPSRALV